MNLEYFIATRVSKSGSQSFSRLIIRIAIVAIALSVTVMIVATALIRGFKTEISNKIFGFWGHIQITDTSTAYLTDDEVPVDIKQDFYPSIDTIGQINYLEYKKLFGYEFEDWKVEKRTKGGIRHIHVFANRPGVIKTKNEIEGIITKGIGKDFDWQYLEKFLVEGNPLNLQDSVMSREIIISEYTANRLNLKIGDTFTIYYIKKGSQAPRKFKLAGIYRTGLAEYDKLIAIVDIRQIQNLRGWTEDEVGGFEVFLDNIDDLEPLTEHIYLDILPANLFAQSIKDRNRSIFDWLELTNTNERVLIALMLLVAIINMMTALLILILERTNMIGILKALGQTNWNIRKIFLYYASYIIVIGLLWGNGIGLLICYLQDKFKFFKLSEEDYYLSYAPIEINWWVVIALNVGTLLVTLIFLIIPSYMVTRISPVKAIRFK